MQLLKIFNLVSLINLFMFPRVVSRGQLTVHRCNECGQPLPESYEPPSDEPWSTGIFCCADDTDSCWTGLFCPCVLFGRNVENLREDIEWTKPCICHAIFLEGGIALATATAVLHGIDPRASFFICESSMFAWWMCGIYTGLFRQSLQKKYHLKVNSDFPNSSSSHEPATTTTSANGGAENTSTSTSLGIQPL